MKTWFNGDSEGKIKRGGSNRKGTLSDELSKADHIGRQLRYNEAELNQLQEQEQKLQQDPKLQESKPLVAKVGIDKGQKEEVETVVKRGPVQMSSPFPPRRQAMEEPVQKVEEPKSIQMSSPFPPRRQAVEEPVQKAKEPEVITFGTSPFPARIQPGTPAKAIKEPHTPWKPQTVAADYTIKYGNKEAAQLPKEKQEIPSPFLPLGEMKDYSYSDSYNEDQDSKYEDYDSKYEEAYDEPYTSVNDAPYEAYASTYEEEKPVLLVEPIKEVIPPQPSKPTISLKSNITISFDKDHTMALNMNIGSVITILNSSGEQFDFKITNDGQGGQNLNIVAPSRTIYQILALFE